MSDKTCFVIAPIGEPDSEIRKRSDQVLKHVIRPAVETCGYSAMRADEISEPGVITSQVIQHIVDEPLVVADLTGRNPNVFYELAIRHALRKPLVQIIRKDEQIPFDVAGTRTIHVDHRDLDSVEAAKTDIISQVHSLERADAGPIETPISVSLDLQLLRQSENPEQRSLADLLAVISEIRSDMTKIQMRINDPEELLPQDYLRSVMHRVMRREPPPMPNVHMLKDQLEHLQLVSSEMERTQDQDRRGLLFAQFNHMIRTILHDLHVGLAPRRVRDLE